MDFTSELIMSIVGGIIVAALQYYFFEKKQKDMPSAPVIIQNTTEIFRETSAKIKCASCSFLNRTGVQYCTNCGKSLFENCPSCHNKKPIADTRCGHCGKDPRELRFVQKNIEKLRNKAYLLGSAYLVILIRILFLAKEKPSSVDILSILIVLPGLYGLYKEAMPEYEWLNDSGVWNSKTRWLSQTTKDIKHSFWIFYSLTFSPIILLWLVIIRVYNWIAN